MQSELFPVALFDLCVINSDDFRSVSVVSIWIAVRVAGLNSLACSNAIKKGRLQNRIESSRSGSMLAFVYFFAE